MNNNTNWGVKQSEVKNTSGGNDKDYHIGYVETLKTLLYLQVFVIPLLLVMPIYRIAYEFDPDIGLGAAVLAYAILAFVLWVALSYFVYLFDNIAHIAKSLDKIEPKENNSAESED